MKRIEQTFKTIRDENRTALIPFIMGGDPNLEASLKVMQALPEAGADLIEIGMPFTDPAADGPAIQLAGQRALAAGASLRSTLDMVAAFRNKNTKTPVILMGYYNPIFAYGADRFITDALIAGADGVIIVDLPPEESASFASASTSAGLDFIRLITPTTQGDRINKITDEATGFLYYVSITGVTGAAKADLGAIKPHLDEIRAKTDLPIAIGFGIKTPDDAAHMAQLGDGVVVGSAIIKTLAENQESAELPQLVADQVSALASALR